MNRTLSGAITLSTSGPRSNGNERTPYMPPNSKTGASPSDGFVQYPGHLFGWEVCRDAVGVFYSLRWQSWDGLLICGFHYYLNFWQELSLSLERLSFFNVWWCFVFAFCQNLQLLFQNYLDRNQLRTVISAGLVWLLVFGHFWLMPSFFWPLIL